MHVTPDHIDSTKRKLKFLGWEGNMIKTASHIDMYGTEHDRGGTCATTFKFIPSNPLMRTHGGLGPMLDAIGEQLSFTVIELKGVSLAPGYVCLIAGIGRTGENLNIFFGLHTFLACLAIPWLVCGDWNNEPIDLINLGCPQRIGGTIRTIDFVLATCTSGSDPKNYDFAIVCDSISHAIPRINAVWDSPWKPHLSGEIEIVHAP